ncbi:Spy/CpxP family protein refolding chaperone [Psychroserpens luteus]|uniref:Spy/CpxP family protein refolding chaperone n=1 Tax=Psychroserpens luteus TaxID=1434066 RepID=A0ABW5ZWP7_9FLAO|nr:Spy/CpxP family protein refolding chaperone [Psychroserpens luteus]
MKKNNILYLLLIILIIMNGFFLFNYLGRPNHKGPKESGHFIVKELGFNDTQLQQFEELETKHHNKMRGVGDDIKLAKDALFKNITKTSISQFSVDSLIIVISEKEQQKEKELFSRLRSVYELCNEEQKEQFSAIIKKAREFDNRGPEMPHRPE